MRKIKEFFHKKNKELLVLLVTLIFIFIMLNIFFEITLRIDYLKFQKEMKEKYPTRDLFYVKSNNPKLIYEGNPKHIDFNSHGFSDYEHNYSKEKGIFRIVVIGDSVALGQNVDINKTFVRIIEKKLNHDFKNKKFEVILLAQSGYSTSQELILFEKYSLRYDPDLIIWSYVMNDPAHPIFHDANGELGKFFFKPKSFFIYYLYKKVFYLNEKINSINCEKEFHKFLHCVYWKDVKKNIAHIGVFSYEKNIPVFFLIHPIFESEGYENYSLSKLHKKLAYEATKNKLVVVDLLKEYKEYGIDEINLSFDDIWHPSVKGHKIIAKYLYEIIRNYKLNVWK